MKDTRPSDVVKFEGFLNEGPIELAESLSETTFHQIVNEYAQTVRDSFVDQYHTPRPHDAIGVSTLGYPAIRHLMDMPHIVEEMAAIGYQYETGLCLNRWLRHTFHQGDVFEAWFRAMLRAMTPSVQIDTQTEVEFCGVRGHTDFIVEVPDGHPCGLEPGYYLIECKTANSWYTQCFSKRPDDDRGYLTQLAVYTDCLRRMSPMYHGIRPLWVILNKDTGRISVVPLSEEAIEPTVVRASRRATALQVIRESNLSMVDALGLIKAPPGIPDVYRNRVRSEYLLPTRSLKFWAHLPLFYYTEEVADSYGKPITIVGQRKKTWRVPPGDIINRVKTLLEECEHDDAPILGTTR